MTRVAKKTIHSIITFSFIVSMAISTISTAEAGPFWFDDFSDTKGVSGLDLGSGS
ncbi:MAG: hypothetical protein GY927_10505 [bacterium]|nr:hypothetical protein [bacterium]